MDMPGFQQCSQRDGQYPVGAPRTRWDDVLGKDLKQLGTTLAEASNIDSRPTRSDGVTLVGFDSFLHIYLVVEMLYFKKHVQ